MKILLFIFSKKWLAPPYWIAALIFGIHQIFSANGLHCFRMDYYMQIVQTNFDKGTPFWEMLYHFHGNPPLLSIIHHIAQSLLGFKAYAFFDILLPGLHAGSFLIFRAALGRFSIRVPLIVQCLIFLNPLIFIYFRYPFYSSFLFFLNSFLLYCFAVYRKNQSVIFLIAAIFSVESLLRTSYSPILLSLLSVWLLQGFSLRKLCWICLLFILPFAWQFKNYLLVGKFTSSTWVGMNLARGHLPWNVHPNTIDFVPTFSMPDRYFEILHDEPRVRSCMGEKNYYLSQNNLNHRVMPVLSDLYLESMKESFSFSWSANTVLNGFLILFKSPANYEHLLRHISMEYKCKIEGWKPDIWEPFGLKDRDYMYLFFVDSAWDPAGTRWEAWKRLSVYTFLYTFLLVYFGWNFRKLEKSEKVIYGMTLFFTLVYITADVMEANRMRMEYEVFFYFLTVKFLWGRKKGSEVTVS